MHRCRRGGRQPPGVRRQVADEARALVDLDLDEVDGPDRPRDRVDAAGVLERGDVEEGDRRIDLLAAPPCDQRDGSDDIQTHGDRGHRRVEPDPGRGTDPRRGDPQRPAAIRPRRQHLEARGADEGHAGEARRSGVERALRERVERDEAAGVPCVAVVGDHLVVVRARFDRVVVEQSEHARDVRIQRRQADELGGGHAEPRRRPRSRGVRRGGRKQGVPPAADEVLDHLAEAAGRERLGQRLPRVAPERRREPLVGDRPRRVGVVHVGRAVLGARGDDRGEDRLLVQPLPAARHVADAEADLADAHVGTAQPAGDRPFGPHGDRPAVVAPRRAPARHELQQAARRREHLDQRRRPGPGRPHRGHAVRRADAQRPPPRQVDRAARRALLQVEQGSTAVECELEADRLPARHSTVRRHQPVIGSEADPFGGPLGAPRHVEAADREPELGRERPAQVHAASEPVTVGELLSAVSAEPDDGMQGSRAHRRRFSSPHPSQSTGRTPGL